MLLRLSLEDFFFIKGQEVYFEKGLNVITGETGTGKSLTVASLLFLMGEEGDYPEGTSVEAEFITEEDHLIVRREVLRGRSRYYLNGRGSTKKVVEEVLSSMLLLQGQNDRTKVLRADFQRDVYDSFAGCLELRKRVESLYQEVKELEERLANLQRQREEKKLRKRYIQERLEEMQKVGLTPEEYLQVKKRLEEINAQEKINNLIIQALSGIEASLEGLKTLKKALRELSSTVGEEWHLPDGLYESLVELERNLKRRLVFYSPEEVDLLNEKVYRVQMLERKHGMSYEEIYRQAQILREELRRLEEEEDTQSLEKELATRRGELYRLYEELSKKRLLAREEFEKKVREYLSYMGLERANLKVSFEEREGRYGREQVKFLFSSYGKDERPLVEVASGGEISRISLALFMLSPPAQTYVLDEVDTGISGKTSIRLAKLLKDLSKSTQLLVITHSPAIASAADRHFTTRKELTGDKPLIRLVELSEEERIAEIARLMGTVKESTLQGARELIKEVVGSLQGVENV